MQTAADTVLDMMMLNDWWREAAGHDAILPMPDDPQGLGISIYLPNSLLAGCEFSEIFPLYISSIIVIYFINMHVQAKR